MSYVKKDEDADQGMIKVDRTSVFQEGMGSNRSDPPKLKHNSPAIQHISCIPSKMSNSLDEDRSPPLHRREVPYERSHLPIFRHLQAFPEQRCFVTADGVSDYQRACKYGRRCDHGNEQYNEGHGCWK
jgi:hypothetical protein